MLQLLIPFLMITLTYACPRPCICNLHDYGMHVNCSNRRLTDEQFNNLTFPLTMSELNLEYNNLTFIDTRSFINSGVKSLMLTGNRISQIPNPLPSTLEKIYLTENNLRGGLNAENFTSWENITEMRLSNNSISSIADSAFVNCTKLLSLFLNGNRITRVRRESFLSLRHLRFLDLSANLIHKIVPGNFDELQALEVFHLSKNRINFIPAKVFPLLGSLFELFISDNNISYAENDAFYPNLYFITLDLSGNRIKTFNLDSLAGASTAINLEGNPLHCSCAMKNVSKLVNAKGICQTPKIMEGKDIRTLSDVLNCTRCSLEPCLNQGTCILTQNSYVCNCTKYFKGRHCEVERSVCEFNPCANNSTCTDLSAPGRFYCKCAARFTGKTCDQVDNCFPTPCLNGGSCLSTKNTNEFACKCGAGFIGKSCDQVDHCMSSPCKNGGSCLINPNNINEFACKCATGYLDQNCSFFDKCANNPCSNGATCFQANNTDEFLCECEQGFFGELCELMKENQEASRKLGAGLIVIIVAGCVVLLVVVAVFIYRGSCAYRRKMKTDENDP